jgi:bifunctional non-homologous end joining protein LigD
MPKRTQTRFIARMIEGAVPSEMPRFIVPQLATLKLKAPVGSKWLHEIKYDGYRLQIHLNKGAKIYTRDGHDWTNRFPIIADAFDIPVERAILDGEVVVVHEGRTNFSELQADLASGKQQRMVFYEGGTHLFFMSAVPTTFEDGTAAIADQAKLIDRRHSPFSWRATRPA